MKTSKAYGKALKKKKGDGSFFDSLDLSLGRGRYLTDNARLSVKPKK